MPSVRYRAEIYPDGDGADFRSSPFAFVRDTREVTSADALTLVLAPGGGQAIRFTRCNPITPASPVVPAAGRLPGHQTESTHGQRPARPVHTR